MNRSCWGQVADAKDLTVLRCKVGVLPMSFLGLPLGAPFKAFWVLDVVEERFYKQFAK